MSRVKVGVRENNFDLLRHLSAFLVVLVHASKVTNAAELGFVKEYIKAEIAVGSFLL